MSHKAWLNYGFCETMEYLPVIFQFFVLLALVLVDLRDESLSNKPFIISLRLFQGFDMLHIICSICKSVPLGILLNDRKLLRGNFHPKWRQNFPKILSNANPWWKIHTGQHWESFSAATIWTFIFLDCCFPLDFINLKSIESGLDGSTKSVPVRWTLPLKNFEWIYFNLNNDWC